MLQVILEKVWVQGFNAQTPWLQSQLAFFQYSIVSELISKV